MPTKGKGGAKSQKSRKRGGKTKPRLDVRKIHPHLTEAILSLKRLDPKEFAEVQALSAMHSAGAAVGPSTGCIISNSGGQQHCVNLPPDVCSRQGGISIPTRCPNT
jgi:hypothetical protein